MTGKFSVTIPPNGDPSKIWVVFTHSHDGYVFFVGYTQLKDFMTKPNLHLHPGWAQYMRTVKAESVQVDAQIYYNNREAMRAAADLYKRHKVPRNMYCNPYETHYRHCIIRNTDTGETFATAKEAAAHAGVAASQMSYHLARKSGYPLIKGHTYIKEIPNENTA